VLAGLAAHLAATREARRIWTPTMALAALAALAVIFAPNLIWNLTHHFATLEHTASNANWNAKSLFNIRELMEFLGSQFGVFGPVPFAVLAGGTIALALRRRLEPADLLLLCLALPPLLTVGAQAFVSRANANWAGVAYIAGSILAAAWLLRWNARRWLVAGLRPRPRRRLRSWPSPRRR
jgi:4-amino-4-deoxy-L-arabinose transferase-like glycosyltransferase